MRIGLLTYYGDLNFGTSLQAYATLQALKKAYPDDEVEVIPLHTFWLRIVPYKYFSVRGLWNDAVRIWQYRKFKKEYLGVNGSDPRIDDPVKALEYIKSRDYDRIYVGADTLLELDRLKQDYDGLTAYWLKDVNAEKFIIAASSKSAQYEQLKPNQKKEMQEAVDQMKMIAVRDRATYELFSHFADASRLEYLPDPTFGYEIDYSYFEKYLHRKKMSIPEKCVYINFATDDLGWLPPVVKELKEAGYKIVTTRPIGWSDFWLNALSPLEQAGMYRYFTFTITHRFHEGVFSLKNHRPVMVYTRKGFMTKGGESKQVSLLKDFGLYPCAFMGSHDTEIDNKDILKRYETIMQTFSVEAIEQKIQENARLYSDFVWRSVGA